ncbi:hypothetical protein M9Y10_041931 [Tritrichomonas musculus]|uniref:Uncharacterized protein n=1 Tax=Tritrichomonas musculus TaxID=1915356 RepID=A0ABR2K6I0_9EUKA
MNVHIDKFTYTANQVSCPLKEHSIINYISRPQKKDRKGRKRLYNSNANNANNDDQTTLVKITPLELSKSAKISYTSYQSALASATESIFEENNNSNPSLDDLILVFSRLEFFDPTTQTFKKPDSTSSSHIQFIFGNSDYFLKRYKIEDNIIYRK